MAKPRTDEELLADQKAIEEHGGVRPAARATGKSRSALERTERLLKERGLADKPFDYPTLPSEELPTEELIARREAEYRRRDAAEKARKLIPVRVRDKGPIGIVHMGDPHVDDPGTNFPLLRRHVEIINATEGLFGANIGDNHNNWVGRLARLYAEQETTAVQAWQLVEWLIGSVKWLYLIAGNHDLWAGAGDPIKWMQKVGASYEGWGARLALQFPNGKEVRINARHDFTGHSMWNTAHGPSKAAQMGWKDHVLVCGHKHVSGYALVKDPATGLISHALRVAGYKVHDRYGKELGLPNQNISPSSVTIIDPRFEDDDPRLIHTIHDVEEAAEYLVWKRERS